MLLPDYHSKEIGAMLELMYTGSFECEAEALEQPALVESIHNLLDTLGCTGDNGLSFPIKE